VQAGAKRGSGKKAAKAAERDRAVVAVEPEDGGVCIMRVTAREGTIRSTNRNAVRQAQGKEKQQQAKDRVWKELSSAESRKAPGWGDCEVAARKRETGKGEPMQFGRGWQAPLEMRTPTTGKPSAEACKSECGCEAMEIEGAGKSTSRKNGSKEGIAGKEHGAGSGAYCRA